MIWIVLLKDADKTFCADHINTLSRSVKKYVVTLTRCAQAGDLVPGLGIEYDQHGGLAGHGEKPMIFLIERHGVVAAQTLEWPLGHSSGLAVDGFHHVAGVGDVHKNVIPVGLKLEGLGMTAGLQIVTYA